jgi:hypothetical protein
LLNDRVQIAATQAELSQLQLQLEGLGPGSGEGLEAGLSFEGLAGIKMSLCS